jgi:hypothetical protein
MSACPYEVRIIDEKTGVSEKCRFCVLKEDGSEPSPACVSTCITKARIFGDLDDPESEISQAIVKYDAKPFSGGTGKAKVYYPADTYELIEGPPVNPVVDLLEVAKPVAGVAAAATVVGLGVSFARGVGYKRDYLHYDPATGKTTNTATGELVDDKEVQR